MQVVAHSMGCWIAYEFLILARREGLFCINDQEQQTVYCGRCSNATHCLLVGNAFTGCACQPTSVATAASPERQSLQSNPPCSHATLSIVSCRMNAELGISTISSSLQTCGRHSSLFFVQISQFLILMNGNIATNRPLLSPYMRSGVPETTE